MKEKKEKVVTFRLSSSMLEDLDSLASIEDCTRTQILAKILENKKVVILPNTKEIVKLLCDILLVLGNSYEPTNKEKILKSLEEICQLLSSLIMQINNQEI